MLIKKVVKKQVICDVCHKDITDNHSCYRFKNEAICKALGTSGRSYRMDMCSSCFCDFMRFIRGKKKKESENGGDVNAR